MKKKGIFVFFFQLWHFKEMLETVNMAVFITFNKYSQRTNFKGTSNFEMLEKRSNNVLNYYFYGTENKNWKSDVSAVMWLLLFNALLIITEHNEVHCLLFFCFFYKLLCFMFRNLFLILFSCTDNTGKLYYKYKQNYVVLVKLLMEINF